jgi:hypothetical protein
MLPRTVRLHQSLLVDSSANQMLEAMMLPSADNLAYSLAIWAYGSLPAYASVAQQLVASLGMRHTTIGSDASGLSPSTVCTASDLVTLGEDVLANRVLKAIVGEHAASFPIVGTIYNVNTLLDKNGIIGIKTGNSDQAGGVYIVAATYSSDASHSVTIVGVVFGRGLTARTTWYTAVLDGTKPSPPMSAAIVPRPSPSRLASAMKRLPSTITTHTMLRTGIYREGIQKHIRAGNITPA